MLRVSVWIFLAATLLAQDPTGPPPPEGVVVRAVVKQADAEKVTLKIVEVDRTNDRGQFDRYSGQLIPKLSRTALRGTSPGAIVQGALLKLHMVSVDLGADVLEVKAPGTYAASEAEVVPERFAKARVKVREEVRDPSHFFVTDVLSMDVGAFSFRWGGNPAGSVLPIDPESLDRSVRPAVGVGTELDLELGPKGIVRATVVSGGLAETKYKGVLLGVGGVLSIVALIVAWIVLRKKLLDT